MKKGMIRTVLLFVLLMSFAAQSMLAGAVPYRDPNTPLYIVGTSFDVDEPEVGALPDKSVECLHDEISAQIRWSRTGGGWDDSMPFEGGYEYTLTITAKTSGKDYIHEWVLQGENTVICFTSPGELRYVAPTQIVLNGQQCMEVFYTFTLEGEAPPPAAKTPFTDIEAGSYCEDAVAWALATGVTTGATSTTFVPDAPCTRAQAVTFLWRALGCPEPENQIHSFTDIKPDDYFYKSVLWAVETGVTTGTSLTTFSPDLTCTGAQVIAFLHRANGSAPAAGASALACAFPDTWFTDAIAWADSTGLLSGVGSGFSPLEASPRADIVTYLYRNAVNAANGGI